jgi:hypothetical protein
MIGKRLVLTLVQVRSTHPGTIARPKSSSFRHARGYLSGKFLGCAAGVAQRKVSDEQGTACGVSEGTQ